MSGSSNRTLWLTVGALGCLVVCLCVVLAGGIFIYMSGKNTGGLLAQIPGVSSPTLVPLPTVTRAATATVAPIPTVTRAAVATVAPTLAPLSTATKATVATVAPKSPTVSQTSAAARPSPTPTCPPSPTLAPGILFNDDFGSLAISQCNGWLLSPGQNVDHTWALNKYTFSINKPDYLGFDWPDGEYDDLAVEMEAQPINDALTDYGIAFRISGDPDTRSYYMFAVTSDGTYYVQEKLNGDWVNTDPVKSTASSAIKQGKTKNIIGVIARGNSIALYINRALVKTFTDNTLLDKGAAGIFAGSNDTNTAVTFSRFTVLTPDKAQAEWK